MLPAPPPTTPVAHPDAIVQGEHFRITVLTDGLLRLEHSPDGEFEDRPSAFALHRRLAVPSFRVLETAERLQVVTDRLRLTYDRGPFRTHGLSVEVLGGVSSYHSVWRYGEQPRTLGGTARTLDLADGPVELEPGVASRYGFSVIDDSRSPVLTDDGWVQPRTGARTDLYVFAYGHDHAAALRAFYQVSGPQPVLPRWALGNWWSRYHPYSHDAYAALMDRFADEGVPLSVAVLDMDWHRLDVDPRHGSGWTGYSWNRDLFPDPEAFLAHLHERGLRVTFNVHPADGVRAFEDAYPAMCAALGREPDGDPVEFDVTDPRFMAAYLDVLHRGLEDQGVDFWWIDWQSGPHSRVAGLDPLWMLNHLHFLASARDGRRPVILSRYAGPGSHRYPIGFSGDTVVSWASLAFQPYFTATAANIGYGWWSHDIGGHMFGAKDEELATRWVQLGVLSPILRLHSSASRFMTKEPWAYGPPARQVQTRWLRLRQRLVPYLHTMNHRAARDGVPLVLPMYHRWPSSAPAYEVGTQYLFGDALMVAPITAPADPVTRTGAVRAWLPPGTWVDVLTGLVYDGDRELVLHRDLTTVPVLATAGAIVPLDGAEVPGNDPVPPAHVELLVVVGADGATSLVEDDGVGDGLDEARIARTPVTFDQEAGVLVVGPVTGAAAVAPATRTWTATFVALESTVASATVDGVGVGAEVRRTGGRLCVVVADVPRGSTLRVHVGARPALASADVARRVFTLLDAAQLPYATKERVQAVVEGPGTPAARLAHLLSLGLPPQLQSAVAEVVSARA